MFELLAVHILNPRRCEDDEFLEKRKKVKEIIHLVWYKTRFWEPEVFRSIKSKLFIANKKNSTV